MRSYLTPLKQGVQLPANQKNLRIVAGLKSRVVLLMNKFLQLIKDNLCGRLFKSSDDLALKSVRDDMLDQIFSESFAFQTILSVPDYRYLRTNAQHLKLIGKTDIIGKTITEIEPDLEAQGIYTLLDNVVKTGIPYKGTEIPIHYAAVGNEAEKTVYLDFIYQPLRDENKKIYAISALGHDVTERVLARNSLEKVAHTIENERQNFRNLFKETPEMVCILKGPKHRFEFVNEAHVRVLGFDATGKEVRDAQPESVEVHGLLDEVYRTGVTARLHEIPVTLLDRVRFFNLTYSACYDVNHKIDGVMILGTEVTDNVLNREGTKLQRSVLEMALDGSPMSSVLEAVAKMVETQAGTGLLASILLLDKDKYLLHGAAPGLPSEYNEAINGIEIGPDVGSCGSAAFLKETVIVEDIESDTRWEKFKFLPLQYGLRSCWSTPIYSSGRNLLGTFALYSNEIRKPTAFELQLVDIAARTTALILERKSEADKRQQALNELSLARDEAERSRQELYSFFMQAPAPMVVLTGPYHYFTLANPLYEKFVGRKVVGHTLSEVFSEEEVGQYRPILDHVYNTGETYVGHDLPLALRNDDGSTTQHWIDVSYTPYRGDDNKIKGILTFVQDVTSQYLARTEIESRNKELQIAKDEAERANQLKSAFLANMSHEIRTPLGAMLGFSDLLRDPGLSTLERSNYIDILTRNGEQLSFIINDILDLSKVEAGHLALEFGKVTSKTLGEEVVSLLSVKAKEKDLELVFECDPTTPEVITTDQMRLRQILVNLVGNAIKFTHQGSVSIRSYGETSADGKQVKLNYEIKDTGIGISKEHIEQLFERFVQADNSMTRRFGGTGLGLALSRRLARSLGGDVTIVSSLEGKGTVFKIMVADQPDKLSAAEETAQANGKKESKLTPNMLDDVNVLVVDDSPDNQELLSAFLENYGAKVDLAENGLAGCKKALGGNFDVIIMDIQMPEMDGYTATQKLRSAGYEKPIIALTAHAMSEVRRKCLNVGCNDHLSKPINSADLVRTVARHVHEMV